MKYLLLLLLVSTLIAGCKKEEEATPPEIEIIAPADFSSITAGDTIHVNAVVNDANGISVLQVNLFDHEMNLKEAIYSASFEDSRTSVELDRNFIISSNDLGTGFCYLQIQAKSTDGDNSEYITLRSFSSKPFLKNLIILSRLDNQSHVLGNIPPGKDYSTRTYEPGLNADEVMVNSNVQLVHVLSKQPGKLLSFDANNFKILWTIEPAYAYPFYTDFFVKDELLYVSSGNSEVSAYNASGLFKFATVQDQEFIPQQFAVSKDYIVTYAERRNGPKKLIRTFYNYTGAFMQHIPLNESIVEIFPAGNRNFLMFGNREDLAVMLTYNVDENKYTTLDSIQGEIIAVNKMSDNEYIIKTGNGWYRYNKQVGSMVPLPYLNTKEMLTYDVLNNVIYATDGSDVEAFSAANGSSLEVTEVKPDILGMDVLYNKDP